MGDIRDKDRLKFALKDVDIVLHAAALKQVPRAEYNPIEYIKTNVLGAQNIIESALQTDVKKVIALSTDKAANPVNLYGATKLCSDKLFVSANNLVGSAKTRFAVVRYGNVVSSRGSVIPLFKELLNQGIQRLPITDKRMTRFVITLDEGVNFVLEELQNFSGGEIFVPKLPSIKIIDLVEAMLKKNAYEIVGIRAGEKLHEVMIPKEEARNCIEIGKKYTIVPQLSWWNKKNFDLKVEKKGNKVSDDFEYTSDKNNDWLSVKQLKKIAQLK